MKPPGSKEAQLKALRERRDPAPARPAAKREGDGREENRRKYRSEAAPKKRAAPKLAAAAKKTAAARAARERAGDVAEFVSRPGGASMEELTKKFGIEAHPMRAKIYNVRHTLGYAVEVREGRYYGTPPAAS
jgi:hypothetical protein